MEIRKTKTEKKRTINAAGPPVVIRDDNVKGYAFIRRAIPVRDAKNIEA